MAVERPLRKVNKFGLNKSKVDKELNTEMFGFKIGENEYKAKRLVFQNGLDVAVADFGFTYVLYNLETREIIEVKDDNDLVMNSSVYNNSRQIQDILDKPDRVLENTLF